MHKSERRRLFFKSFEAKSLRNRPPLVKLSDDLTAITGTPTFLFFNAYFFVIWVVLNTGILPFITPFDPYPFGFLTMMVSLEAIFLSIFVLISQNRSAYISTLRDEVHLQLNIRAEREITKTLEVLSTIRKKMGITEYDPELEQMLQETDTSYIEQRILDQLERANRPLMNQLVKEFPDMIHKKSNGLNGNGEKRNGEVHLVQ